MKNLLKCLSVIITFLVATTLFYSCTEEQTSFSLRDIETTATIIGNLCYSEGQTYSNENVIENIKIAAGKKVYVEISNSDLDPKRKATGYSTFETTTDMYGNYDIEVPAIAINQGVQVSIKAENFIGQQTVLEVNEEGEIVRKEKTVIFTSPIQIYTVKPNDLVVADIKYNTTDRNPEEEATPNIILKIKIGVGALKETSDHWIPEPYFFFKENIRASVTVSYEEYRNGEYITIENKYGGITDVNGEFTLQFPVAEKSGFVNVVLEASSFRENSFVSPYYGETRYLTGTYQLYYKRSFVQSQKYDLVYYEENNVSTIEARMVFEADYGQSHSYYPGEYNWEGILFE